MSTVVAGLTLSQRVPSESSAVAMCRSPEMFQLPIRPPLSVSAYSSRCVNRRSGFTMTWIGTPPQ